MRRRIGVTLLNCAATLVALGGIVDMVLPAAPASWLDYLGSTVVSPETSSLLLGLLRALGGCLVAIGLTALLIINGPLLREEPWARWALLILIGVSEGINASQMWRFGSPYYIPLAFIALTVTGLAVLPNARADSRPSVSGGDA
jgi:hypothetical protein